MLNVFNEENYVAFKAEMYASHDDTLCNLRDIASMLLTLNNGGKLSDEQKKLCEIMINTAENEAHKYDEHHDEVKDYYNV